MAVAEEVPLEVAVEESEEELVAVEVGDPLVVPTGEALSEEELDEVGDCVPEEEPPVPMAVFAAALAIDEERVNELAPGNLVT